MAKRELTPEERESCVQLGKTLKLIVRARNVDVLELANVLRMSDKAVYARMNGTTPIAAHELLAIADYLGIEPGALLRGPDDLLERMFRWNVREGSEGSLVNSPEVTLKPSRRVLQPQ